jgi:uncharacterized membrane protein YvbJ
MSDTMYCVKCGQPTTDTSKRCSKCGNNTFSNLRPRGQKVEEEDESLVGVWKKYHMPNW